ncbi:hypothetical protein OEB99_11535 [Actinotalea sp. M2MS4P-6]|uniref:hypothetical protein n=1 Tax=Actinotalea sp. M2MS4P-6 TaxID=2983762 RepID=UPI0021E3EB35|nr:hypothetical protein [Actinotalea sp. M2MS4P-6]MCV2394941.1 hypothetical protein [Actinotalea sp. M2MS4P-6]
MYLPFAHLLARASVLDEIESVMPWAPPVEDRSRRARVLARRREHRDGARRRP